MAGHVKFTRRSAEQVHTDALVVRRVPVGEADLLVTLLTRERGLVSASARGARRATSKLGALEPMHGLRVTLAVSVGIEVARLVDAKMTRPRSHIVEATARLEAAARVLRWARSMVPPHAAEPAAFAAVEKALDALDSAHASPGADVRGGLQLLTALGWGLELTTCVACGTPCPIRSSAWVDPAKGGLICRACGGGPTLLSAGLRAMFARAADEEGFELDSTEHAIGVTLVDDVIAAHAGVAHPKSRR